MSAAATKPPLKPLALAAIRAPFEAFAARAGGVWTGAPVTLPLGLLLDLAGEAMRERLAVLGGSREEQALRPDFTIPIARAHLASGAAQGRYLYEGDAFRAGREGDAATAFLQIGVEVFGPASDPAALDAGIATLAWTAACAGGRSDLSLRFGDAGLFARFLAAIGVGEGLADRLTRALAHPRRLATELERAQGASPQAPATSDRLSALLSGLPEGEAGEVLEQLWRLAGIQPVGGRSASEIVHRLAVRAQASTSPRLSAAQADLIHRYLALDGAPLAVVDTANVLATEAGGSLAPDVAAWTRRMAVLPNEAPITLATAFVGPFGYYDGVLFEVLSEAKGAERPLAVGGRYDGLLTRLGAKGADGAVGCMVRPRRILLEPGA